MIFLMPIYFIIACVVIYMLMKRYKGQHKWRRFFLLAFLFYLPVGWDVILGRAYFYYLCHKDGGVHIYQTVELGPEYWDKDGRPKFYTADKGAFDSSVFDGRYVFEMSDDRYTEKRPFRTIQYVNRIVDTKTDKILGEWFKYGNLGGWVMNTGTPFGKSEIRCHFNVETPDNPEIKGASLTTPTGKVLRNYSKFTSYIFIKKESAKGEEQ